MSAAEVIAEALRSCGIEESEKVEVPDVLDALKAAGYSLVKLPSVAHKGPNDTDARMFRRAAKNLEDGRYIGGGNLQRAIQRLLLSAADALDAAEADPDPHAGQLWANELQRRQQQVPSDREWS